ncbi:hypothetical protein PTKIN_Ptkin03bG0001700 [Pterospermum kingtungense]
MKVKALIPFRSKLFNPCRKIVRIFRFKLKRPVFVRALVRKAPKTSPKSALLSVFRSLGHSRKMDKLAELRSLSEAGHDRLLFPSALTPAYMKGSSKSKREDVEDACRSFENYLVEMIVEEGKVSDLMDVEELLYCWKNLTCPVFIDLVSRFYGVTELVEVEQSAAGSREPGGAGVRGRPQRDRKAPRWMTDYQCYS